ncbi:MAG: cobyrinic acid a,c-diamide synthase [Nitrospirales bacterium]|nr:MAG: cobyrinic acid a,c-diamide synthase [Nitrospirales bacterium]
MMTYPRLLIAGTHSGVGKTTVTLALLSAFRAKGRRVQPFKVGPDFIDPGHHHMASGRDSRNLDGWMLDHETNRTTFLTAARDADLSIVEGMMGLFDGSSPVSERGSAVEQAKQLGLPILLVVDASAMARSAAAMVHGYAMFDPALHINGVLFNRIKSDGHFRLLKDAVENETKVKVVGYVRPDPGLTIPDRHLGLQTAIEGKNGSFYESLGQSISETVDLDLIEQLAQSAPELTSTEESKPLDVSSRKMPPTIKVGVAYDPAFCFYYQDNLEMLEAEGAELVKFSPLHDRELPPVDLLYIGGGYPEVHAAQLEKNVSMRKAIQDFAALGRSIYAECGGLMYLTSTLIDFHGRSYEMVGVIPGEAAMSRTKMVLGYRELTLTCSGMLGAQGIKVRGHEFHYSCLQAKGDLEYGGSLADSQGRDRGSDGITVKNVMALYTHLHFSSNPHLVSALLQTARDCQSR